VPYAGSAQGVTDLLGGRVQVMFSPASSALEFVRHGELTALASTQLKRASALPDLPTISESGLPGYDVTGWFGIFAPVGTPPSIIERLARAILAAAKSDAFTGPMRQQGFDMDSGRPEEFAAFLRTDMAKWGRVAAAAGLRH